MCPYVEYHRNIIRKQYKILNLSDLIIRFGSLCLECWQKAGPGIDNGGLSLLGLARSEWQPRGLIKSKNRFGLDVCEPIETVHRIPIINYSIFTVRLNSDVFIDYTASTNLLPDRRKLYLFEPIKT